MDSGDARVEDCSNILNSWQRGSEDAEDEREAAILMLVKKGGGNTENVASQRKSCASRLWKRLRKVECSSIMHATSLNP